VNPDAMRTAPSRAPAGRAYLALGGFSLGAKSSSRVEGLGTQSHAGSPSASAQCPFHEARRLPRHAGSPFAPPARLRDGVEATGLPCSGRPSFATAGGVWEPSRQLRQVRGLRVEASRLLRHGEAIFPSPGGIQNKAPEPTRPLTGLALSSFAGAAWLS